LLMAVEKSVAQFSMNGNNNEFIKIYYNVDILLV
jgi:hypothetical protein